ncbi:UMP kinase [Candidatus Sumerlaeota bacterium]|nr:UMP kinase [Candidatus Sumerlaeota bacterium]
MSVKPRYKRILLKISGELLKGRHDFGFDSDVIADFARQALSVVDKGVQVALVVGGGNIFRGAGPFAYDMDRTTADNIGMLATLINALMLQDVFEKKGMEVRILSAIPSPNVAEPFIRRQAIKHLEAGRVVIFACGTGSPFFTTDTAAALRANEIDADVLLKGTKVRGVFSDDPEKTPDAVFFETVTYDEVLIRNLKIMDAAAFAMCRDNALPIIVFDFTKPDNLLKIVMGKAIGTLVKGE